ncbi:ATP-binding protein [Kitasatospora aureofaciens]|uniref:ATP-binding protein n=1 Tax=Kitasatospora aureofaciens TaxID=1894 RepID=UPI0033CEA337
MTPATNEAQASAANSRTGAGLLQTEDLLLHPSAEPLLPTGELLLSELVTNAVTHARTPRGRLLFVRLQLLPHGTLRIEVHDADSEKPTPHPSSLTSESGRGLLLVRELASEWGYCPRRGGIGKFIWCHVSASPEAAAA